MMQLLLRAHFSLCQSSPASPCCCCCCKLQAQALLRRDKKGLQDGGGEIRPVWAGSRPYLALRLPYVSPPEEGRVGAVAQLDPYFGAR
uniref:Secreted protein n=1 Tax=Setaria viridis TaxID=4556 RepID=A0A4U6U7J0_SETVI|nr:hypothetical protein SEVIR_6G168950v2 [Setaria viridis]